MVRDRSFNLQGGGGVMVYLFRSELLFFWTTRELKYIFFLRNSTLGYMTKTLNQIFFFLHQNQNIFFSNIGNQNIFFRKKPYPPPGRKMVRPFRQNQSCKWNSTKKLHQLLLVWCMCVWQFCKVLKGLSNSRE
jgi:hypothetical protein